MVRASGKREPKSSKSPHSHSHPHLHSHLSSQCKVQQGLVKDEVIRLSICEYMDVLLTLFALDESIWTEKEKLDNINQKFTEEDVREGVIVAKNGKWTKECFQRAIRKVYEKSVSRYIIPLAEVFFICLNEHHEALQRKYITPDLIQKAYESNSLPELFENPDFCDRIKSKQDLEIFYADVATFDLEPYSEGKTNEQIREEFTDLFDAFDLPQTFEYSLSGKYIKIFEEIRDTCYVHGKKMLMYTRMMNVLKNKSNNLDEKMGYLFELYPDFSCRQPIYQSFNLDLTRINRDAFYHKRNIYCPSITMNYGRVCDTTADLFEKWIGDKYESFVKPMNKRK